MAEIATPIFGYKSHIGIDQRHGFIRTWSASDAARSKVRSAIEHVFATQKHRMGLFIRTIGLANITFNFKRYLFRERRTDQSRCWGGSSIGRSVADQMVKNALTGENR